MKGWREGIQDGVAKEGWMGGSLEKNASHGLWAIANLSSFIVPEVGAACYG